MFGCFTQTDILELNRLYECGKDDEKKSNKFNWQDGDGGKVTWAPDCNFPGHDISYKKSRPEECGGICLANPKCTHFTWDYLGYCNMKSAVNPNVIPSTGAVCGSVKNYSG